LILAIAAFVCLGLFAIGTLKISKLGFFPTPFLIVVTGLPSAVVGYLALREIERSQGRLKGKLAAMAAIVIGSPGALLSPLLIVESWRTQGGAETEARNYYDSALAKHMGGDLEGAIADYNRAVELNPKLARAYRDRGNVKRMKGDLDGAVADCTKAIELHPSF